jgi:hypothetical protein
MCLRTSWPLPETMVTIGSRLERPSQSVAARSRSVAGARRLWPCSCLVREHGGRPSIWVLVQPLSCEESGHQVGNLDVFDVGERTVCVATDAISGGNSSSPRDSREVARWATTEGASRRGRRYAPSGSRFAAGKPLRGNGTRHRGPHRRRFRYRGLEQRPHALNAGNATVCHAVRGKCSPPD